MLSIELHDFGTTVEILFNNIWDSENSLRKNIDEVSPVRVIFTSCQEFRLNNGLNQSMLQDLSMLNWGFNEIATLQIEDATKYAHQYANDTVRFKHAVILWEGERRIDIVFGDIEIIDG